MPKLPLFQNQPLDDHTVAAFRELLSAPERSGNMPVIDGLLDINLHPNSPPSEPLAMFVIQSGVLGSPLLENFMVNHRDHSLLTGKRAAMRLQINQRVLAHAAAGFMSAKRKNISKLSSRQLSARAKALGSQGMRGWLSPDGLFFESEPTPQGRILGLELGGHEAAALHWLEENRPDLLDKLEDRRIAAGFEDWIEADGLDIIKKFMFENGFVRVADND